MFDADIAYLRTLLLRVACADPQTPDQREQLNVAYDRLVQAITALEQVEQMKHDPSTAVHTASVADLFEAITQEERLRELE